MERADAIELVPNPGPADAESPTHLQERIAVVCAGLAGSFRAIQTVSGQTAALLETGAGTGNDLAALVQVFGQLDAQAGERLTILGALCSSAGSA